MTFWLVLSKRGDGYEMGVTPGLKRFQAPTENIQTECALARPPYATLGSLVCWFLLMLSR